MRGIEFSKGICTQAISPEAVVNVTPADAETTIPPIAMLCAEDTQEKPAKRPTLSDTYEEAREKAAADEDGKQNPAMSGGKVPTRAEQIEAMEKRQKDQGSMAYEAGRWLSAHIASALGNLSVQTT